MADAILCAGGVYAIRNILNGKCYVGSAENIARRFSAHRSLLRLGRHHSSHLQRAWLKHGAQAFTFEIIEYVQDDAMLLHREQWHIDRLRAASGEGYNVLPIAGSRVGYRHTEEAKLKIGSAFKGKKRPEHSKKLQGRKRTDEQKAKMVAAHLGAKRSEETRRKISEAAKGRKNWAGRRHSEASKAKMRASSRRYAVCIDGLTFDSCASAGRHFGRDPSTVANWLKSGKAVRVIESAGVSETRPANPVIAETGGAGAHQEDAQAGRDDPVQPLWFPDHHEHGERSVHQER